MFPVSVSSDLLKSFDEPEPSVPQTHTVEVVDGGFEWRGTRYRSLSAVAKAITGTNWNGRVFFGLKASTQPGSGPPSKRADRICSRPSRPAGQDPDHA
jgi:hypothetical protein